MMILSLDIETYGACAKNAYGKDLPRQTVFQPRRSLLTDGVSIRDLILTCSITPCQEKQGCQLATESNDSKSESMPSSQATSTERSCSSKCSRNLEKQTEPSSKDSKHSNECKGNTLDSLASLQIGSAMVHLLHKPNHRRILRQWLKQATTLIGMNLMFDVSYLRTDPEFRPLLNGRPFLIDLAVLNREECDLRPERGLKNIGPALSLYKYDEPIDLRKGERYPSPMWKDPKTERGLVEYNAADTHNSALLAIELARRIIQQYGHSKLTDEALAYYNDTIWSCIRMSEAGVPMHRSKIEALQEHLDRRAKRAADVLRRKYRRPVEGIGSEKPRREFIEHMLDRVNAEVEVVSELGLDTVYDHPLCKRTKKQKRISFGAENRVLAEVLLTQGARIRPKPDTGPLLFPDVPQATLDLRALKLWGLQQRAHKVASTYTAPLLSGRRNKTTKTPFDTLLLPQPIGRTGRNRQVQLAHPSIYIVPSSIKDTSEQEGGQRQSRLAFKNPAVQTFPQEVKALMVSRFDGGSVRIYDLAQIELRVPALLSGDPVMLDWFENHVDPHTQRAVQVFGDDVVENPHFGSGDTRYDPRQWCKKFNFEDLYLAGPDKMQLMLLKESHKLFPIGFFQEQVAIRTKIRPGLTQWQNRQIAYVHKYGRSEMLPVTGQHRTFMYHHDLKPNEIVNFPIQATASNVELFAQHYVHARLPGLHCKDPPIVLFLNWYDALWFDVAPGHEDECDALVAAAIEHLVARGYWHRLEETYNRHVPLVYETKVFKEAA